MTSSIVARMSKNRRIPDGGTARTRCASARSARGARAVSRSVIVGEGYAIRLAAPSVVSGVRRGRARALGGGGDGRIVERREVRWLQRPPGRAGRDALVGPRRAEELGL